jgi:hypothetical protein
VPIAGFRHRRRDETVERRQRGAARESVTGAGTGVPDDFHPGKPGGVGAPPPSIEEPATTGQSSNIDLMLDLENATPFELAWPSANSSAAKVPKVAVIACMRKLIVILNTMIARRPKWDPSRYVLS